MSNQKISQLSPLVQVDLSELATTNDVLLIREHAFLGHLNIRGPSDKPTFIQGVKNALGMDLPIMANTFVSHNDITVLWLGPDEWLVLTPQTDVVMRAALLRKELAGVFSSVTDLSGGNTVLEISGTKAQALLRKGCPIDLHASVFKTGQCAQTVLGKTNITLWQTSNAPIYKLIVRRSFADYLGHWLIDAAREFST